MAPLKLISIASICLIQFAFFWSVHAQKIIYVDSAATGANSGTSWEDAYIFLQDGFRSAGADDEIWVSAGTYYPDDGAVVTEGDRETSFDLKNGVSIYGGFTGNESLREDRDVVENRTILSGDLLNNDSNNVELDEPTRSDNSYHVIKAFNLRDLTIVDGFTITGGNATENRDGGGIYIEQVPVADIHNGKYLFAHLLLEKNAARAGGGVSLIEAGDRSRSGDISFRNVIFQNNYASEKGGGMNSFVSTISLEHVNFINNYAARGAGLDGGSSLISWKYGVASGNTARAWGGAVHLSGEHDGQLDGINLVFAGNSTEIYSGGAVLLDEAFMNLTNAVFTGNSSGTEGGAIGNLNSKAKLTLCSFSTNRANTKGGAIYNSGGDFVGNFSIVSNNSIFWGNSSNEEGDTIFNVGFDTSESLTELRYSIIESGLESGVIDSGGNLFENPLFVDPDGLDNISGTIDDNLRLMASSPAIDSGNNQIISIDTLDIDNDGDITEKIPADLDDNTRIFSSTGSTSVVDMGAYEFNAPPLSTEVVEENAISIRDFQLNVFPNPLAKHATIHILTPGGKQGNARLTIYDSLGRKVQDLYEGNLGTSMILELVVPDHLKSGVYFLRGVFGEIGITKQIVIMN